MCIFFQKIPQLNVIELQQKEKKMGRPKYIFDKIFQENIFVISATNIWKKNTLNPKINYSKPIRMSR